MDHALESIFKEKPDLDSLLETVRLAINSKVTTVEEAETMISELSSEATKFNALITTITNAMRQVEQGEMSKEEAVSIVTPAVKELKEKCVALKISNIETSDMEDEDITEEELNILRELIVGAKSAAEDRLVSIKLGDDNREDPEINELLESEESMMNYSEYMFALEEYMDTLEEELAYEAATEGIGESAKNAAVEIGAKLRGAFGKLRNAIRGGKKEEIQEAQKEVDKASKELETATNKATDPEEKKGLSKAAKIGIAAAATVAIAAGLNKAGKTLADKATKDPNVEPRLLAKTLIGFNKQVENNIDKIKQNTLKAKRDRAYAEQWNAKEDAFADILRRRGPNTKITKRDNAKIAADTKDLQNAWLDAEDKYNRSIEKRVRNISKAAKSAAGKAADAINNLLFKQTGSTDALSEYDLYDIFMEAYLETTTYDIDDSIANSL